MVYQPTDSSGWLAIELRFDNLFITNLTK